MESTCPDTLQHSSVFIDFSADFGLKILRRKFLGEVILEPNCQPELIMLLALNIPLVLFQLVLLLFLESFAVRPLSPGPYGPLLSSGLSMLQRRRFTYTTCAYEKSYHQKSSHANKSLKMVTKVFEDRKESVSFISRLSKLSHLQVESYSKRSNQIFLYPLRLWKTRALNFHALGFLGKKRATGKIQASLKMGTVLYSSPAPDPLHQVRLSRPSSLQSQK